MVGFICVICIGIFAISSPTRYACSHAYTLLLLCREKRKIQKGKKSGRERDTREEESMWMLSLEERIKRDLEEMERRNMHIFCYLIGLSIEYLRFII